MATKLLTPLTQQRKTELDTNFKEPKEIEFMMTPSTLETVDRAFFQYVDKDIDAHTSTSEVFKKVPVIWQTAERSFQIKNNKDLRDKDGKLKFPVITVERTGITKSKDQHGKLLATLAPLETTNGGQWLVARRINQEKTALFASSNSMRLTGGDLGKAGLPSTNATSAQRYFPVKNKQIVYESIYVPVPVYVSVNYSITIKTLYQQHINESLTPFITKTGNWSIAEIGYDGHTYEAFLPDDYGANNNVSDLGEEERLFETKFDVRVLAYLIGHAPNQDGPEQGIRENIVKIRLPREQVIFEDPHPRAHKGQFYKE